MPLQLSLDAPAQEFFEHARRSIMRFCKPRQRCSSGKRAKEKARTLGVVRAFLVDRRRRVWGDQATIKAAWFKVAKAAGAKRASAAAMQKNLDMCELPSWCWLLSEPLMQPN